MQTCVFVHTISEKLLIGLMSLWFRIAPSLYNCGNYRYALSHSTQKAFWRFSKYTLFCTFFSFWIIDKELNQATVGKSSKISYPYLRLKSLKRIVYYANVMKNLKHLAFINNVIFKGLMRSFLSCIVFYIFVGIFKKKKIKLYIIAVVESN